MKKLMVSVIGAFASVVAWGFPSAVTEIQEGQTVNFAASAKYVSDLKADSPNKYGSFVYAHGDCTLKVTVPAGAKAAYMCSVLFVTNGVLTLDLTDVAAAKIPYYQCGGIVTRYGENKGKNKGKIIVKGMDNLLCGDATKAQERFEIQDGGLEFQNASGETIDGLLTFTNNVGFVCAPTGMWELAPKNDSNKTFSIVGVGALDSLITTDGSGKKYFDLPYNTNATFTVAGQDPINSEATIRIGANQTLNAYYTHYADDSTFTTEANTSTSASEGFFWSLNGYGKDEHRISNDVELLYNSSILQAGLRVITFKGEVRGSANPASYKGKVNITSAGNNDYCRTWFEKPVETWQVNFKPGSAYKDKPFDLRFFDKLTCAEFNMPQTNTVVTFAPVSGVVTSVVGAVTGYAGEEPKLYWQYPAICAADGAYVKVASIADRVRFVTQGSGKIEFDGFVYSSSSIDGALLSNGKFVQFPADFKVVVAEGQEADVSAMRGATMEVNGKAKIAFAPWSDPIIWLDASADGSVSNLWLDAAVTGQGQSGTAGKASYKDAPGYIDDDHLPFMPFVKGKDKNTYYYVEQWNDCRGTSYKWYVYNNRHRSTSDYGWWPGVYPIDVPNGLNGLPYVAMDDITGSISTRRLAFNKVSGNYPAPKFAVLVYGSQSGGGKAILGNVNGAFARDDSVNESGKATDINLPIMTNKSFQVWLDGVEVDPTVTKLSGGWQIISIQLDGKTSIGGLGFNKTESKDAGGMNYAEAVFFETTPTDEQRIDFERRLARKWGLTDTYKGEGEPGAITAYGRGEIELDGAFARPGGAFAGKITLKNGAFLDMTSLQAIPTDEDVAKVSGRTAWFDPDAEGAIKYQTSTDYTTCVNVLYDRTSTADGAFTLASAPGRAPGVEERQVGYAPARKWLNYANVNPTKVSANEGNALRVNIMPNSYDGTTQKIPNTRTVMMVMDSSQGGGSPFLDSLSGDKIVRFGKGDMFCKDWTKPIWNSNAVTTYFGSDVGGATYLNGMSVDGSVTGFTGGPEVLTAIAGKNFNVCATGGYNYKDYVNAKEDTDPHTDVGELQGEMLVFNTVLSDADRQMIESYLMYKWIGMLPYGVNYASVEKLTVSGDGAVRAKTFAALPAFDAFTGTVEISEESEFSATVAADGTVTPAFDLDAAVSLPAQCTIALTVQGSPENGWYTIARAAGGLDKTEWTLKEPAQYKMQVTATEIKVKIPGGLLIIVQ